MQNLIIITLVRQRGKKQAESLTGLTYRFIDFNDVQALIPGI
jgi:hypothetical protein